MDKNVIIIGLALGLATLAAITFFARNHLLRSSQKRRRSDKSLSGRERKAIEHAKALFSQGRPVEAAKLLEGVGLVRECVNLLQESGEVDEAANVLLRLGRPNRAGVVYTRHGRWEKAVECFKMANMPLEVARCAREAGDFETAASHFLKTEHFAEAADCFAELGDIKKSARYHSKAGNHTKAIDQYLTYIEDSENRRELSFEPEELDFLVEAVVRGSTAVAFAQVLEANGRLADAITNLTRFGNVQGAAKLYAFASDDIDQRLTEAVGISESAGKNLGELFKVVEKPLQAAKIFEKVGLLKEAARCYEEAGAFKDAGQCYRTLNNQDKYLEMQSKSRGFADTAAEPTAKLKPGDFAGLEETKRLVVGSKPNEDEDEDQDERAEVEVEVGRQATDEKSPYLEAQGVVEDETIEEEALQPDDTRSLADATIELAREKRAKDMASPDVPDNYDPEFQPEQTTEAALESDLTELEPEVPLLPMDHPHLPYVDEIDGSAPKSIPLTANSTEPPPVIERKQHQRPRKKAKASPKLPEPPSLKPTAAPRAAEPSPKKRPADDDEVLDNRGGNLPDEKYKVKARANAEPDGTYDNTEMDEVFARSKILYDLKKAEKRLLWKLGETLTFKEKDVLLEPNQTPRGIFFVLSGSLSVVVGPNSTNEERREVYPGETFAAHWVFLDELIEARFIAKETTEVRVISREDMQLLLDNNGTLARKLYKNMTRQIRFDFLTSQNNKGFNQAS